MLIQAGLTKWLHYKRPEKFRQEVQHWNRDVKANKMLKNGKKKKKKNQIYVEILKSNSRPFKTGCGTQKFETEMGDTHYAGTHLPPPPQPCVIIIKIISYLYHWRYKHMPSMKIGNTTPPPLYLLT